MRSFALLYRRPSLSIRVCPMERELRKTTNSKWRGGGYLLDEGNGVIGLTRYARLRRAGCGGTMDEKESASCTRGLLDYLVRTTPTTKQQRQHTQVREVLTENGSK